VLLVSPAAEEVIMTPALNLEARVAEGWTVLVEVERARVSDANVGERRVDHQSKTTTYSFVGINLRPGPNRLRVTPVSPEGVAGEAIEQTVYGRGPAVRLEIVTDRKELQADGRDATTVRVRGDEVKLTPTEFALLAHLVANPRRVLTHRMLLQRVWGEEYGEEPEYLRVYINRLRRKLEEDPAHPRHLQTEPGVGYRFTP
jgi:hypothetical protein